MRPANVGVGASVSGGLLNSSASGRPGARGVPASSPESRAARASRLSVVVRKRPMNKREQTAAQQDVVMCRNSAVIVREPKLKVDLTRYVEEHNFLFDQSFDETVSNEQLYISAVRPIIDAVFQKAKCTCFAYGQTGSGKTFTMMGPPRRLTEGIADSSVPGIFLLAARDVFEKLASTQNNHLVVYIAFYEIYCGKLYDLLNNRQLLHARENAKNNVVIVGLQEHPVENVQELMEVIEYGLNSRTTGVTGANVDSSRSHAILQISLKDPQRPEEDGRLKEHGKVSFIDLAGSERGADHSLDQDRQTRMDGAEINKSLLALKECIRALDQQLDHTPFRGSKLTQVLKDSFVGSNCRTVMIANVSPTSGAVEHSLNTLRYAYRVKELRSNSGKAGAVRETELGSFNDPRDDLAGEDSDEEPDISGGRGGNVSTQQRAANLGSSPRESRFFEARTSTGSSAVPAALLRQRPEEQLARPATAPLAGGYRDSHQGQDTGMDVVVQTTIRDNGDAGAGWRSGDAAAGDVMAPAGLEQSQAALDELARQHDRLIGTILAEEEELITAHRQHIDMMVELIKEEMVHLNNVDRPGSDVDAYVAGLDRILKLKAEYIGDIRGRVDLFKDHLHQEDTLSRKFQSLASSSSS